MILDYLFYDHRLYLGAGKTARFGGLSLIIQINIRIISLLLVLIVVKDIRLAFEFCSGFSFYNRIVKLYYRSSTLERRRIPAVYIRHHTGVIDVQPCCGRPERRKI